MKFFNKLVAKSLPLVPKFIIKKVSSKYIAGETIEDAVRTVKELNQSGFSVTLDVLGEFITKKSEADKNAEEYIRILEQIHQHQLNANISIKPTSMALLLDEDYCYEVMKRILTKANEYQIFVRIDMEDLKSIDAEFRLLSKLREEFSHVGIVLQAYLKRTYEDVDKMIAAGIGLRLCKGIYIENPKYMIDNANNDRLAINPHFLSHLKKLLENKIYVGIATHDEKLVEGAYQLIRETGARPENYEFQMLLGVREQLRDSIIQNGHRLRIYVPFGKDWYGYSVRRLNENPSIAGYVLKAMLTGK
ncbi:MAG: proline dehydrogenase family protein [Calditrichaeota bacterium]|nr:proline dehydrogenase family protein [Calditrichota bacterium]